MVLHSAMNKRENSENEFFQSELPALMPAADYYVSSDNDSSAQFPFFLFGDEDDDDIDDDDDFDDMDDDYEDEDFDEDDFDEDEEDDYEEDEEDDYDYEEDVDYDDFEA